MNPVVPSRRLLRQLAVACRSWPSTPRSCTNCSIRTLHTQTHTNSNSSRPIGSRAAQLAPQHRSTSTSTTPTSNATASATATPPQQPSSTPDISNHYTLFPQTLPHGPPPGGPFHIPLPLLRREFLAIQALHHPDKHQHSSESPTPAESPTPHRSALALSSLINTAYRTLSDPLLRAQYLLHHTYGVDVSAEDNSTHGSDPETLMQVLDAQERIEDARTQAEIDEIRAENATRIADTVEELARAFERDDPVAATRECVRLRYWRSLGEGLHDWEPGKEVRLVH